MPAGERPRRVDRQRRFPWDPITTAELAVQPDHEMIFARKVTPTARSSTEIERPLGGRKFESKWAERSQKLQAAYRPPIGAGPLLYETRFAA